MANKVRNVKYYRISKNEVLKVVFFADAESGEPDLLNDVTVIRMKDEEKLKELAARVLFHFLRNPDSKEYTSFNDLKGSYHKKSTDTYKKIRTFLGEGRDKWIDTKTRSGAKFLPPKEYFGEVSEEEAGRILLLSGDKINADNTAYLERFCSMLPRSEFFSSEGDTARIEDYYIPLRFENSKKRFERAMDNIAVDASEEDKTIQDVIDSVLAEKACSRAVFIIGSSGSGRLTALYSMVYAYVLNKQNKLTKDTGVLGITTPFPSDAAVLYMNIQEISTFHNNRNTDFFEYVNEYASHAFNAPRNDCEDEALNDAQLFTKSLESICSDDKKKVIIIIQSPESFEGVSSVTAHEKRKVFWRCLAELTANNNNVSVFCATTDTIINELAKDNILHDYSVFGVLRPNDDDLRTYITKWADLYVRSPIPDAEKTVKEKFVADVIQTINNNSALKDFVMTGPQAATMFLESVRLDDKNHVRFKSQAHMLKIISKETISSVVEAAANQDRKVSRSRDEYDFLIPVSALALQCCTRQNSRSSLSEFTQLDIDDLFDEDKEYFRCMSSYLTDAVQKDSFEIMLSNFPLLRSHMPDRSFRYSFEPVWRNYYAAYAIAHGIFISEAERFVDKLAEFTDLRMRELRDKTELDTEEADMWVSVIAMAAKLSRDNVEVIITILEKYARDFSPKHRRGREIAVIIMLKLIRNRCFVSKERRERLMENTLSFFIYHKQLDDLDALISTSVYRESLIELMFSRFNESVDVEPIPLFHFAIGYLVYNFVNMSDWDGSVDGAKAAVLKNTLEGKRYFEENKRTIIRLYNDPVRNRWNIKGKLIFDLAINDLTWMTIGREVVLAQYYHRNDSDHRLEKAELDKIKEALLFLSNIDTINFQESNAIYYALSHILADERKKGCGELGTMLLVPKTLSRIIFSDYSARRAYDEKVDRLKEEGKDTSNIQPYCGALRTLTLLEPSRKLIDSFDISCFIDNFIKDKTDEYIKKGDNIGGYYRGIWNRYRDESMDEQTGELYEAKRDNARRYLMLMFRPCILVGAFADREEKLKAIRLLWSLKYREQIDNCGSVPETGNIIGLEYDHEEYFYAYLLRLYRELSGAKQ